MTLVVGSATVGNRPLGAVLIDQPDPGGSHLIAPPPATGASILDDFSDNQGTAPTGWSNWGSPQVAESGQQLNLTTTTGAAYFGIDWTTTLDLTGQ
ncbi:MAG: hypothetical protein ABW022_20460, partial [Actinoplanes sp.]